MSIENIVEGCGTNEIDDGGEQFQLFGITLVFWCIWHTSAIAQTGEASHVIERPMSAGRSRREDKFMSPLSGCTKSIY